MTSPVNQDTLLQIVRRAQTLASNSYTTNKGKKWRACYGNDGWRGAAIGSVIASTVLGGSFLTAFSGAAIGYTFFPLKALSIKSSKDESYPIKTLAYGILGFKCSYTLAKEYAGDIKGKASDFAKVAVEFYRSHKQQIQQFDYKDFYNKNNLFFRDIAVWTLGLAAVTTTAAIPVAVIASITKIPVVISAALTALAAVKAAQTYLPQLNLNANYPTQLTCGASAALLIKFVGVLFKQPSFVRAASLTGGIAGALFMTAMTYRAYESINEGVSYTNIFNYLSQTGYNEGKNILSQKTTAEIDPDAANHQGLQHEGCNVLCLKEVYRVALKYSPFGA